MDGGDTSSFSQHPQVRGRQEVEFKRRGEEVRGWEKVRPGRRVFPPGEHGWRGGGLFERSGLLDILELHLQTKTDGVRFHRSSFGVRGVILNLR